MVHCSNNALTPFNPLGPILLSVQGIVFTTKVFSSCQDFLQPKSSFVSVELFFNCSHIILAPCDRIWLSVPSVLIHYTFHHRVHQHGSKAAMLDCFSLTLRLGLLHPHHQICNLMIVIQSTEMNNNKSYQQIQLFHCSKTLPKISSSTSGATGRSSGSLLAIALEGSERK